MFLNHLKILSFVFLVHLFISNIITIIYVIYPHYLYVHLSLFKFKLLFFLYYLVQHLFIHFFISKYLHFFIIKDFTHLKFLYPFLKFIAGLKHQFFTVLKNYNCF